MTGEEAMALSDCGRGCYIIGGPLISYDPDCPLHGDAAREKDQKLIKELMSGNDTSYDQ